MAEHAMDVRSGAAFVRQRWRVVAACGLVGLGLGLGYAAVVPAELSSTALVLLPGGSGSPSDGAIVTQVRIALSTPVLEKAGRSVTPALSAAEVRRRVDVEAATAQIIQIQASSSRAREAQALSQAVAQAYVTTLQDNANRVTDATVEDLRSRQAALTQQIQTLQTQITATSGRLSAEDTKSAVGRRDAQLLAQLTTEQSDLALQLDKVKQGLSAQGTLAVASATASIIQPADPATGSGKLGALVTWGIAGALLGAAGAAGAVLVQVRRDPRLRARDELADSVGSNVLADVRSRPQRSVAEWSALFETHETPAIDAWAFRQVLRGLAAAQDSAGSVQDRTVRVAGRVEYPRSLSIVSLAGDGRGAAVGPQLAVFAASLGIRTRFVISSPGDCPASLWAACTAGRGSQPRPGLVVEAGSRGAATAETASPGHDRQASSESVNGHAVQGYPGPARELVAEYDDHHQGRTEKLISRVTHVLGEEADYTWLRETNYAWFGAGTAPAEAEPEPNHAAPRIDPADRAPQVPEPRSVDLTIVLTVIDREEPTLLGVPTTAVTMLAIAPGVASREEMARLAVAVDDVGRRIDGIVVADPDPSDRTTGRRTLDERARHEPLPVRMTGISQVTMSSDRGQGR